MQTEYYTDFEAEYSSDFDLKYCEDDESCFWKKNLAYGGQFYLRV